LALRRLFVYQRPAILGPGTSNSLSLIQITKLSLSMSFFNSDIQNLQSLKVLPGSRNSTSLDVQLGAKLSVVYSTPLEIPEPTGTLQFTAESEGFPPSRLT
jgi:hypothetical protein